MSAVPAIIIANMLLIAAHAVMLFGGPTIALDKLSRLPTAWGAFFGSLVGLIGVAWTAQKGFRNLIAAQEHRAKIEISAREHQKDIDLQKNLQVHKDRQRIVANTIAAELVGLLNMVHEQMDMTFRQMYILKKQYIKHAQDKVSIKRPKWYTPIWDQFLPEIGLLGPSIAGDLVTIYYQFSNLEPAETELVDMHIAIAAHEKLLEHYNMLSKDIVHMSDRIKAYMSGEEDPGVLLFSSHRAQERIEKYGEEVAAEVESQFRESLSAID